MEFRINRVRINRAQPVCTRVTCAVTVANSVTSETAFECECLWAFRTSELLTYCINIGVLFEWGWGFEQLPTHHTPNSLMQFSPVPVQ